MRLFRTLIVGGAALAWAMPQPVQAQYYGDNVSEVQQLRQRLDAYETELRTLRSEVRGAPGQVPAQPVGMSSVYAPEATLAAEAAVTSEAEAPKKPEFKKVDAIDKPTLKMTGRIFIDNAYFGQNAANRASLATAPISAPFGGDIQDGMNFRALRLGAEGVAYEVVNYKLEVDFAGSGRPSFQDDDYIGISEIPVINNIRVGRFKEPFSLEETTSGKYTTFMERSLPNAFAPKQTMGIAAFDWSEDELMTWGVGVFRTFPTETGDDVQDNDDRSATARVTWLPYYDDPSNGRYLVHLGAGYSFRATDSGGAGDDVQQVRFRERPEIRMREDANSPDPGEDVPRFVDTGVILADSYQLFGAEAAWVNGPLSVQSEFMYVPTNLTAAGDSPAFTGAYVYVSYFLTGESRTYNRQRASFDRIVPFTNYFWVRTAEGSCRGSGAWELAARWSYLDLTDEGVDGGRLDDVTLGLNWYLNPYTRLMFNYIHAEVDRAGIDSHADIFATRFQIDF